MNETTIVGDALRAHWADTDEQVTTLGFTAPALRRRARRQVLVARGTAAAATVVALGAAVGAAVVWDGRDGALPPSTVPTGTTAVLSDGRTLTLREGTGEVGPDGVMTPETMTSVCVAAPAQEEPHCLTSATTGPMEALSFDEAGEVLAGFLRSPAARVEVALSTGGPVRAASAVAASGRTTVFGLLWADLGVADPDQDGRTVTVSAYDGAGVLVSRFGLVGSTDLLAAHPPRSDVVELPTVEGSASVWAARDGWACVKVSQLSRRGVTAWCGETIPGGTSVLHHSQVDDASGLVLRVPVGTRSVRVGSLAATVNGEWASVVSDRPIEPGAVVRVTGAGGAARDVGTVGTLRVDGTYSGQLFADEVPGR